MERAHDPSHPEAPWLDAWRGVLFASARVLRVADPALIEDVGFPLIWFDVLSRLYDAPGGRLRMQELQDRSLFTRSGMTRLIDRMEAAGLVAREPVEGDRRGVLVVLTPEGRQRYQEAFAAHLPVIEREFARRLTPDQQRAVADALSGFWHQRSGPAAASNEPSERA
jgi:DNA-binding MarR family transcriptional regulator